MIESDCLNLVGRKIQLNKTFFNALLVVIDWVAFFFFGIIALVSVQGIWSDYSNTKTSLSWSSETISSHPTITMCFSPKEEAPQKMFDLHTEFNISYAINSDPFIVLKEQENDYSEVGNEIVHLERLYRCYKISTDAIPTKGEERSIKVEITPHLEQILSRLPHKILFFLTSAANSYGVEEEIFIEGNPYETQVKLQHQLKTMLKPKKIEYLKETRGGCEDSGFWNLVESTFASEIKRKCPLPCEPFKLPNSTFEDCLKMGVPKTERSCNFAVLFEVFSTVLQQNGFVPCNKIEYSGIESDYFLIEGAKELSFEKDGVQYVYIPPNFNDKATVIFTYKFDTPETTDVFSEYIIVDTMTMIGSIGGTLGLYVGFSFFDFAMQILGWIQMLAVKISQSSIFKEEKKNKQKKEVKPEQEKLKKTQVAPAPNPKNAA